MSANLSLTELIEYTDWERGKWHERLRQHGDDALAASAGPNGDGRFQTIGDVVRHIFSAEKRYIDRLSNRPLTDTASIPTSSVEALFQFGRQSRTDLKEFVEKLPVADWDVPQDFNFMNNFMRATPRKLVVHVLMHEIRHWAQIGTLFRMNGLKGDFHDFLFSPVLGGEFKRSAS
jgi:uncharacterized damage-inducible protein DinB